MEKTASEKIELLQERLELEKEKKELIFSLKNNFPVPTRVSYRFEEFYLTCEHFDTKLSVKLYEGELKYFFENYKTVLQNVYTILPSHQKCLEIHLSLYP